MALQFLHQTSTHEFYRDFFNDVEVIFTKEKTSGEVNISVESVALVLGFKNFQEMIENDEILDLLNDYTKKTENPFPIHAIKY